MFVCLVNLDVFDRVVIQIWCVVSETCGHENCSFMNRDRPWFICPVAAWNDYVEMLGSMNHGQPDNNADDGGLQGNTEFDAEHSDADDNEDVDLDVADQCNDLPSRPKHPPELGGENKYDDDGGGLADAGIDTNELLESPLYLKIMQRGSGLLIEGSRPPKHHTGWVLVNSAAGCRTLPMDDCRTWIYVKVTLPAFDDFISVAHWFERDGAQSGCITETFSWHGSRPAPSLKRKRQW